MDINNTYGLSLIENYRLANCFQENDLNHPHQRTIDVAEDKAYRQYQPSLMKKIIKILNNTGAIIRVGRTR